MKAVCWEGKKKVEVVAKLEPALKERDRLKENQTWLLRVRDRR